MDLNSINIIGRLGKDPEEKTTSTGKLVAKFSVAVNGYKQDETIWLDVDAWGRTADYCLAYLKKGSKVAISGRLTQRKYEGKTYTGVTAENVQGLDKREDGERSAPAQTATGDEYDPFADN
jgi:single-strand DNA-binding protein